LKLVTTDTALDVSNNVSLRVVQVVRVLANFQVSRHVMIESSDHFKAFLAGPFQEANQAIVQLEDETVKSVELWLRCLHGGCFTDESYEFTFEEILDVIQFSFKRGLETEKLDGWFTTYWRKLNLDMFDIDDYRQMLYPCKIFDNPWAFARASRYLVFNGLGHIQEKNSTEYIELRLGKGIISK
jgi:hypothetical protein